MMKFCEPEEFDYPIDCGQLKRQNIPSLLLEIDLEAKSYEQIKTRVQTFADTLQ